MAEEISEDEAESTSQRTIEGDTQKARKAINGVEDEEEEPALDNAWARN